MIRSKGIFSKHFGLIHLADLGVLNIFQKKIFHLDLSSFFLDILDFLFHLLFHFLFSLVIHLLLSFIFSCHSSSLVIHLLLSFIFSCHPYSIFFCLPVLSRRLLFRLVLSSFDFFCLVSPLPSSLLFLSSFSVFFLCLSVSLCLSPSVFV